MSKKVEPYKVIGTFEAHRFYFREDVDYVQEPLAGDVYIVHGIQAFRVLNDGRHVPVHPDIVQAWRDGDATVDDDAYDPADDYDDDAEPYDPADDVWGENDDWDGDDPYSDGTYTDLQYYL